MITKSDFLLENENTVPYFQNGVKIGDLSMIEALQLQIYVSKNSIEDITFYDNQTDKIYKILPNGTHEYQPPIAFTQFNRLLGEWIKLIYNI